MTSMIPVTIKQLEIWMKINCYNFMNYSINGNLIDEGCGISYESGLFVWYYTERGNKETIKKFATEKDVVEFALEELKKDKWAKSHLIGFTSTKEKSIKLKNLLQEMSIEFFQDEIRYTLSTIIYRTFVFGCDIFDTFDLRDEYYESIST